MKENKQEMDQSLSTKATKLLEKEVKKTSKNQVFFICCCFRKSVIYLLSVFVISSSCTKHQINVKNGWAISKKKTRLKVSIYHKQNINLDKKDSLNNMDNLDKLGQFGRIE